MGGAFERPMVVKEGIASMGDADALRGTKAYEHVEAYFVGVKGRRPYAGATFETIGHPWRDDATINTITLADVVSLGTLSAPLKGYAPAQLLDTDFQAEATKLLLRIDPDVAIDSDEGAALLAPGSPAARLYFLVKGIRGMGRVRTSKMLARKRPGLIPIRDGLVERALNATGSPAWWRPYREMLTTPDSGPLELAAAIHRLLSISPLVTPLRVIDVILWRSVESPGASQDADKLDAN